MRCRVRCRCHITFSRRTSPCTSMKASCAITSTSSWVGTCRWRNRARLDAAAHTCLVCLIENMQRSVLQKHDRLAVHVGWKSELPDEDDGVSCQVVEQDGGAIPTVVCLATLRFPAAIAPTDPEGDFAEHIPVIRQHLGSHELDCWVHHSSHRHR